MVMDHGKFSIRRRPLDGSRPEETVYSNDAFTYIIPIDWSPDGKYLSVHTSTKEEFFSNWTVPLDGGKVFRPAATAGLKASEYEGRFSFDNHWLTYFSMKLDGRKSTWSHFQGKDQNPRFQPREAGWRDSAAMNCFMSRWETD